MRNVYILLLGLIFFVACGNKKTIRERDLVKILAEMHLADAALVEGGVMQENSAKHDSTAVYTAILDEYGYTVEQLYNSMKQYSKTKNEATKLYDKVYKQLDKLQKQYAKEVEKLHIKQNRWTEKSDWRFPNDGDTSRLEFSIPVDSLGSYILSADIALLKEDSVNNPRITMYLYNRHCYTDSVRRDSVAVDTMLCVDSLIKTVEQPLVRDEKEQQYTLTIVNNDTLAAYIRGYVLNHNNDSLSCKPRHATVRNVMLRYVAPSKKEEVSGFSKKATSEQEFKFIRE